MRTALAYLAALVVGALLFATPFLRYGFGGGHAHAAHSDHGARHGGHLFMLGHHHLELVEGGTVIELYLSDSKRRPLRPAACIVQLGDGVEGGCAWGSYRSVAQLRRPSEPAVYHLTAPDGTRLTFQYPARP